MYLLLWNRRKLGSRFDRNSSLSLQFCIHSLHSGLQHCWCYYFVTGCSEYSPSSGIKPVTDIPPEAPCLKNLAESPYLILPTFCYTYSSFAFVTKVFVPTRFEVFRQDYIRLPEQKRTRWKQNLWTHVFRNCLLPIITLFSNVFRHQWFL